MPILQSLGLKHVGYGVQKAHYDVVGQAFIATLSVTLQRHFTEPATCREADFRRCSMMFGGFESISAAFEVKNAYLKVWTVIKDTMVGENYKS